MQNANNSTPLAQRRAPPPALNPESCALVQPWKDFVSKGWIEQLTVSFRPNGIIIEAVMGTDLGNKKVPLGIAKDLIIKNGLWAPRQQNKLGGQKIEQARPKKSLVKQDFDDGATKLLERTAAVAAELTDTTAKGRIGSKRLYKQGCDTFPKWWAAASGQEKVQLFTDQKRYNELTAEDFSLFGKVVQNCPFRGPVPTPETDEEEVQQNGAALKPSSPTAKGSPK